MWFPRVFLLLPTSDCMGYQAMHFSIQLDIFYKLVNKLWRHGGALFHAWFGNEQLPAYCLLTLKSTKNVLNSEYNLGKIITLPGFYSDCWMVTLPISLSTQGQLLIFAYGHILMMQCWTVVPSWFSEWVYIIWWMVINFINL